MKFCSNCGIKIEKQANFCPSCGNSLMKTSTKTEEKNIEIDSRIENPEITKAPKVSRSQRLPSTQNFQSMVPYFTINKNIFFSNNIPLKPLLKLLRVFSKPEDKALISKLRHLIFYTIEESSSIGGWDLGFTLSIFSSKLYLVVVTGEPLRILHKSTTNIKEGIYEIFDFENTNFNAVLSLQHKLIIELKDSGVISSHTIQNHEQAVFDLIDFIKVFTNYPPNTFEEGIYIHEDILKKNDKLNFGEIVTNIIVILIAIVSILLIISAFF